jgi:hypothetical protein
MIDERFSVPDFDMDDDDPICGECERCGQDSRFLKEASESDETYSGMLLCGKCRNEINKEKTQ